MAKGPSAFAFPPCVPHILCHSIKHHNTLQHNSNRTLSRQRRSTLFYVAPSCVLGNNNTVLHYLNYKVIQTTAPSPSRHGPLLLPQPQPLLLCPSHKLNRASGTLYSAVRVRRRPEKIQLQLKKRYRLSTSKLQSTTATTPAAQAVTVPNKETASK